MHLERETDPRSGWTGERGGLHFFAEVLEKVVISVGATPTSVPVAVS